MQVQILQPMWDRICFHFRLSTLAIRASCVSSFRQTAVAPIVSDQKHIDRVFEVGEIGRIGQLVAPNTSASTDSSWRPLKAIAPIAPHNAAFGRGQAVVDLADVDLDPLPRARGVHVGIEHPGQCFERDPAGPFLRSRRGSPTASAAAERRARSTAAGRMSGSVSSWRHDRRPAPWHARQAVVIGAIRRAVLLRLAAEGKRRPLALRIAATVSLKLHDGEPEGSRLDRRHIDDRRRWRWRWRGLIWLGRWRLWLLVDRHTQTIGLADHRIAGHAEPFSDLPW